MDDGAALLRAICARPDEDVPRLAYADFLDEHGDPLRAEFIRAQCELARHPWHAEPHGSDCRPCELRARVSAIEREARQAGLLARWAGPAAAAIARTGGRPPHPRDRPLLFHRGFVAGVRLPLAAFMRHAAALFAENPIVSVALSDRVPTDAPHGLGWEMAPGWPTRPDQLPRELFRGFYAHGILRRGRPARWHRPRMFRYALAWVCVCYGRTLAGLPPVPFRRPLTFHRARRGCAPALAV